MGIHKKFFPVAKMPWHTDDHKFGERSPRSVLSEIMPLPAPPIDPVFLEPIGTVALVDGGNCYFCGHRATYAFKGYLYCPTCWIALDEDLNG